MEILNISMAVISIVLGIVSIIMAINSKKDSEKINQATELKLLEIKNIADYTNKSSERIENNINNQMQRIINSTNPTQEEKIKSKILENILPVLLNNEDLLKKIIKYNK